MIHLKVQQVSFAYRTEAITQRGTHKGRKKNKSNYDRQLNILKVKLLQNAHT